MNKHHHINYIELAGGKLEQTKRFYSKLCGWEFIYYGTDYAAIQKAGIDGGFDCKLNPNPNTTVILYSNDLNKSLQEVKNLGGVITIDIFEFPGGKRFHFRDPAGNHLAIWSDK